MSDNPAAEYAAALVAFQAELPHVGKDSRADIDTKSGKGFGYSYADLTAITTAAFPLLTKHGLAFTAKPTVNEAGTFVLRYELKHSAGHCDGGDFPLSQGTMQQIGSAITYARRYALCAVTGIAPGGEDDDGAKASEARPAADPLVSLKQQVVKMGQLCGLATVDDLSAKFAEVNGGLVLSDATEAELRGFLTWLDEDRKRGLREHKQLVAETNNTTQAGHARKDSPDKGRVERVAKTPDDDPFYEPVPADA